MSKNRKMFYIHNASDKDAETTHCSACSKMPFDPERIASKSYKCHKCIEKTYKKYSRIIKIPHSSERVDEKMCNVENLKKMCDIFLSENNTVEETDHLLYTFSVVWLNEKDPEGNRAVYQEMLNKLKPYLYEKQPELENKLFSPNLTYWQNILDTYNHRLNIYGFDFLTPTIRMIDKEKVEAVAKKCEAEISAEETEKIQQILYNIKKSSFTSNEYILNWEEPFMGATVRIDLVHSDTEGWYLNSWVYCRTPNNKKTPVSIPEKNAVDDWIIAFIIKYKMYQTTAYEKVNTKFLTEALLKNEI